MFDYYDPDEHTRKIKAATDKAFAAFHLEHPDIPINLHPLMKTLGKKEVMRIAEERIAFVNKYIKANYPGL